MVAPATETIATQFGVTNTVVIAMMTSVFVLAYGTYFSLTSGREIEFYSAFGPLFLGPLSEIFGRSRVLQLANLFYLGMSLPDR